MTHGIRACFNRGLSTVVATGANRFTNEANKWAGRADDGALKVGQHVAGLGREIALMNGDHAMAQRCDTFANVFESGRVVIWSTRVIFPLYQLFTGQMFWQTTKNYFGQDEFRQVQCNQDGTPIMIAEEDKLSGVWVKEGDHWNHSTTGARSDDGKYIDVYYSGESGYVMRDWMSIAMDILVTCARIIAPIRWLHNSKTCDLGHHAKGLSGATIGIWGFVMSLNLIQAIRDLVAEVDLTNLTKRIWDAIQAFVDLVATLFDLGFGAGIRELAIVGAVFNILSGVSLLVKDAVYYS